MKPRIDKRATLYNYENFAVSDFNMTKTGVKRDVFPELP